MTFKQELAYLQKMDFKRIIDLFEPEIRIVEDRIYDLFKSKVFIISHIGHHLTRSGGKRLRPLFLLLSTDMVGYKGDARYTFAGIIESIHTASLLHDDVVDGAEVRRGKSTAHSTWGNQVVILVGDFLYSNALKLSVSFKNQQIMETLSEATTRMTEGELFQLNKLGDPNITEDEYTEIISSKTGVLFSAACRIGGLLGSVSQDKVEALARFGMKTGITFQMTDDILDYVADENELGKRLGKDLEEGKITLPILCLMEKASDQEVKEVKEIIGSDFTEEGLNRILGLFRQYNVIETSLKKAHNLLTDAKAELAIFPDSVPKENLLLMADYALSREK